MKKKPIILTCVIVLLVLIVGGYFIFRKPTNTPTQVKSNLVVTKPNTKLKSTTTQAKISNSVFSTKSNTTIGQYLVTATNQALYTYKADSKGTSNCSSTCLANWPPYQDTGTVSDLPVNVATIKRSDNGEVQYTYKGLPLYTFSGDASGQVTGNNVSNFVVARP